MDKLAVVFGGSGFLGRQVVRALCQDGWRVRVAVRRAHQSIDLRVEGAVGQVQLLQANIRSPLSINNAVQDADLVINLVGVLFESGRQKFNTLHTEGAANIAAAANMVGAKKLIHVSAIGADLNSNSEYARSKAAGEQNVLAAFPSATIIRPSVLFGEGDGLFERFAAMARITPVLPLPGMNTKMQPVYVGDVAKAIAKVAISPNTAAKTYELGGPETLTLGQIVQFTLREIDRKRIVIALPKLFANAMGFVGDILGALPLVDPFLTRDQVALLDHDNVVANDALSFADLGMKKLETVEAMVPPYLERFRRYGQFHETQPS